MQRSPLRRTTLFTLATLVVATALGSALGSPASAAEPRTADDLFSNSLDISLVGLGGVSLSVPLGDTVTQVLTITAREDLTLTATSEWADPADTLYVTREGVCPAYRGSVAMKTGNSCTQTIHSTPNTPGTFVAGLYFSAQTAVDTVPILIPVRTYTETVVLSAADTFGTVPLGDSRTTPVTLTNVARYDFSVTQLFRASPANATLRAVNSTCGDTLAARSSCTYDLVWTPLVPGKLDNPAIIATGTMVGYNAYPTTIRIGGETVAADAALTATPVVDFGSVTRGTSAEATVRLTNAGNTRLLFTESSGTLADLTGMFTVTGTLPDELAAGESVDVPVRFTASATDLGAATARFEVTVHDLSGTAASASVDLLGVVTVGETVTPPTIAPGSGAPSPQPADDQLAVTGQGDLPLALAGVLLLLGLGAVVIGRRGAAARA